MPSVEEWQSDPLEHFSVKSYSKQSELTRIGWGNALMKRFALFEDLAALSPEEFGDRLTLLIDVLNDPVPTAAAPSQEVNVIQAEQPQRPVREITAQEMHVLSRLMEDDRSLSVDLEDYDLISGAAISGGGDGEELPVQIFEPARKFILGGSDHEFHLTVDLHASDDQLTNEFGQLLRKLRVDALKAKPEKWKTTPEEQFPTWSQYQVLAYLDLRLIELYLGKTITNPMKGDVLFGPLNVDRGDKVRRTTAPLAMRLIDIESVNALLVPEP